MKFSETESKCSCGARIRYAEHNGEKVAFDYMSASVYQISMEDKATVIGASRGYRIHECGARTKNTLGFQMEIEKEK